MPFEKSLDELERVVARLEKGNLPLEESLLLFEQGVKSARQCRDYLAQAEKRVEILMGGEAGPWRTGPLADDEDEAKPDDE